jgi:hypothetical protein
MAIAAILTSPDPGARYSEETFSFEHAMAHRNLFGAMATEGTGLSGYTVLPYKLDPDYLLKGGWKLDHGQAHADFQETLPTWYSLWGLAPPETLTISTGQNFVDPNLANKESLNWWTFANHQEHLIAQSVVPLTLDQLFPFW